jgi:hypothetical protein
MDKILVQNYKCDNNLKILNENNMECLICTELFNNNIVQLTNNFCKCFNVVLLCEKCFILWFVNDNKCFICHIIFKNTNDKMPLYKFTNKLILLKLKTITDDKNVIIDIDGENVIIPRTSNEIEMESNNRIVSINNNVNINNDIYNICKTYTIFFSVSGCMFTLIYLFITLLGGDI